MYVVIREIPANAYKARRSRTPSHTGTASAQWPALAGFTHTHTHTHTHAHTHTHIHKHTHTNTHTHRLFHVHNSNNGSQPQRLWLPTCNSPMVPNTTGPAETSRATAAPASHSRCYGTRCRLPPASPNYTRALLFLVNNKHRNIQSSPALAPRFPSHFNIGPCTAISPSHVSRPCKHAPRCDSTNLLDPAPRQLRQRQQVLSNLASSPTPPPATRPHLHISLFSRTQQPASCREPLPCPGHGNLSSHPSKPRAHC